MSNKKCPKCGRQLIEIEFYISTFKHTHALPCKCQKAEIEKRRAAEVEMKRLEKMRRLRGHAFTEGKYMDCTFEKSDKPAGELERALMRYVENWDKVKLENIGIILFGWVGTGKTYYAAALVNALVDKGVPARMWQLGELLQEARHDKGVISDALDADFVVLDDLGSEAMTPYGLELLTTIIDKRVRQDLPLLITTNMRISELESAPEIGRARVYDRILEMCPVHLRVHGESRRRRIAESKKILAKEILK